MPSFRIYKPHERPDVEVLVEGAWCPGELRMWVQHDDATWTRDVAHRLPGESSSQPWDVRC